MPWYLLRTKPRQEARALLNLQRQGYGCLLPTMLAERIRAGRLVAVQEPMFANYLFIELHDASNWMPIRSTLGVQALVRFGANPARVPQEVVQTLTQREQAAQAQPPRALFNPGQMVQIQAGPFAGLEAVFHMRSGEARALVLIEMLQKSVRLSVDVAHLAARPGAAAGAKAGTTSAARAG